jgi:hypothetical protein
LADIADQVNVILTQRGVEDTRAVTPKLALPIFEESSLEDDPALMDLWAQLLANAMDPAFKGELRYAYTEIIKNLSPIDAKILSTIYELARQQHRNTIKLAGTVGVQSWRIVKDLNISEADYEVSASNLMRLRCISPCLIPVRLGDGFKMNRNETLTIDKGSSTVVLTPLGVTFLEACGTPQSIPAPAFSVAQGVAVAGTVELSSSGILVE